MGDRTTSAKAVKTIRLDEDEVAKILDELDAAEESATGSRNAQSFRYRNKAMVVRMHQPGSGDPISFLVPTRRLSKTGMAFLHGGFVHAGTNVVVQLITSHGTWNHVPGKVARCQYVENNIHDVDIAFTKLIDPVEYCAEATTPRVLLAEDDPSSVRLATFHLEQLNADVDHAPNGQVAVDLALKNTYDIILMDIEMPVMDGIEAIKKLRAEGYSGMIVAATARTSEKDHNECIAAGATRYLKKPIVRADLAALIEALREEPVFSTYSDDPSMSELINAFVDELPSRVREIEQATVKDDSNLLKSIARNMKGQGTSYGFDVITEISAKIEDALIGGAEVNAVRAYVDELVKLCRQVRPSSKVKASE